MKWIKIFDSKESADLHFLDTNTVKVVIGEKELCLVRFNDQYFAVSNVCPHQYENLSKGQVTSYGEIVCPLHFYRFSLKTGAECQHRTNDLKTFNVRSDGFGVFIFC